MHDRRISIWLVASFIAAGLVATNTTASFGQKRISVGAEKKKPKAKEEVPEEYKDVPPVLRFKMTDIDGNRVELKEFKGNVILMVNIASKSEYAQQAGDLQQLYEKYKDQGFVVLAFPSNDFEHESGNSDEIKKFFRDQYKGKFHIFEKVGVKGDGACELYQFLSDKQKNSTHGGPIESDFTKFLVDRRGEIRARYKASEKPGSKKMIALIERLLKVKTAKQQTSADEAKKPDGKDDAEKDKKDSEEGKDEKETP